MGQHDSLESLMFQLSYAPISNMIINGIGYDYMSTYIYTALRGCLLPEPLVVIASMSTALHRHKADCVQLWLTCCWCIGVKYHQHSGQGSWSWFPNHLTKVEWSSHEKTFPKTPEKGFVEKLFLLRYFGVLMLILEHTITQHSNFFLWSSEYNSWMFKKLRKKTQIQIGFPLFHCCIMRAHVIE